jgi:acetyl esterase/lipase
MNRRTFLHASLAAIVFHPCISFAAETARELKDIAYVGGEHELQKLDIYLPANPGPHPLIVYVHGGAWRGGSKNDMPLGKLVAQGFAVASVDYRLSTVAPFPAQMHDIKAAIRFLRAKAGEYGLDARRFAIAGSSAGGHLAALAGVTAGNAELEGSLGAHRDQSSAVQTIISLFGASDLTTILAQSTPQGLKMREPALQLLLGGQPDTKADLARLASPVFQVAAHAPPLLLIHGDQDPQMPINQAHELQGRYEALGLPVEFHVIHGAKHGGGQFYDDERIALMHAFLKKHLHGSQ